MAITYKFRYRLAGPLYPDAEQRPPKTWQVRELRDNREQIPETDADAIEAVRDFMARPFVGDTTVKPLGLLKYTTTEVVEEVLL